MRVERIDYRVEHHYSLDAEYPRLGARYRVDALAKELFLFAYLPDEYNEDHVTLGLAEMDRQADTAARIAVQAVAAEREALLFLFDAKAAEYHKQVESTGYLYDTDRAAYMEEAYREAADAIRARAGGEQAPMPPESPQG